MKHISKMGREYDETNQKQEPPEVGSTAYYDLKCEQFLEHCQKFQWFLDKYFPRLYGRLVQLAKDKNGSQLITDLNWVWFGLPDHKFNIIENPPGWSEFLDILED